MRQCIFQTVQSGKFSGRFFQRERHSNTAIASRSAISVRSTRFMPSNRHLRALSYRTIGAGRQLNLELGFGSESFASFSSRSSTERPDPFARRPTSKCDPYDQGGKPLTLDRVLTLARTVEPEWRIAMTHYDRGGNDESNDDPNVDETTFVPFAIRRFYWHDDYMQGAQFSTHVAAVAQMNAQHFPHEVVLSRKLESRTKTWKICTEIVCRTHVLQGLSHHDFYLATLIDIEVQRPEVKGLLSTEDRGQK